MIATVEYYMKKVSQWHLITSLNILLGFCSTSESHEVKAVHSVWLWCTCSCQFSDACSKDCHMWIIGSC